MYIHSIKLRLNSDKYPLPFLLIIFCLLFKASPIAAQEIDSMSIRVTTADAWMAGTDDDVWLVLEVLHDNGEIRTHRWYLDNPGDDFERGDTNVFNIYHNTTPETITIPWSNTVITYHRTFPDHVCKIVGIGIRKSSDEWFVGGWKLGGIILRINGDEFYYKSNINKWLEDDDRAWYANFSPEPCPQSLFLPNEPPPRLVVPTCCTDSPASCEGARGQFTQADDNDCDGMPNDRDKNPGAPDIVDSDQDGIPDNDEDRNHNGIVDVGETDPNNRDTDGDGIPDGNEDYNVDTVIGACESDPLNPDTNGNGIPDGEEDRDGDGLPDWYEDVNRNCTIDVTETNWVTSGDTDGDGWSDGPSNIRTTLVLREVELINEQTDIGDNEIFVTFNHARYPLDSDLDGRFSLSSGESSYPFYQVARRTRGWVDINPETYSVRIDIREDDTFDWTDDDFVLDRDKIFSGVTNTEIRYLDEDFWDTVELRLKFIVIREFFVDPNPLHADADSDRDGLSEEIEHQVSTTLLGQTYGLADPEFRDIFMELDWTAGEVLVPFINQPPRYVRYTNEPARYSKEDISSRFTFQGYQFHLDDGVFGGGGPVVPVPPGSDLEEFTYNGEQPNLVENRNQHFNSAREGIFRYALVVENVKNGLGWGSMLINNEVGATLCGRGDQFVFEDADEMNYFTDIEAIVWLHEFGHNLGLCHLPGDPRPVTKGPGGARGCSCCDEFNPCNCTHYSVGRWSDSAMGSGIRWPYIDDIYQAIDREIDYDRNEWAVIDLSPVSEVQNPIVCPP